MRGVRLTSKIRIKKGFTERKCMCCGSPFASEGKFNRLCNVCKSSPRTRGLAEPNYCGHRVVTR